MMRLQPLKAKCWACDVEHPLFFDKDGDGYEALDAEGEPVWWCPDDDCGRQWNQIIPPDGWQDEERTWSSQDVWWATRVDCEHSGVEPQPVGAA